ncbi:hypothetical protein COD21_31640 [Bacillus cereus]|uniref:hypothetical protein n=1 Tax=Bacillus cereus TaxID=1396 RepID=UPI000BFD0E84|nr:hypothetical protein [Bacillus cereus]PGT98555.1 hypothetical protein COD21_31640 [Bacillus cereus]
MDVLPRHPRTRIPNGNYINAQMWYSTDADTGDVGHTRITQHKSEAESIFLSCRETFTVRNIWGYTEGGYDAYATLSTRLKAEDTEIGIDFSQDALDVYKTMKSAFPEMNVLICFVEGNNFMKNGMPSDVIGHTHPLIVDGNEDNYIVLLSESAEPSVLAHELGHVLNYSNKNGRADDPDPYPGDPDHNANRDNLMYKYQASEGGTTITPVQCDHFFDSKIVLQN